MLPIGAGLMIVAPEAIVVLGGPDWSPAVNMLRVLAATILVQAFINLTGSLLSATGRAAQLFRLSVGTPVGCCWYLGLVCTWEINKECRLWDWRLAIRLACSIAFVPVLVYCLRSVDIDRGLWFWNLRQPHKRRQPWRLCAGVPSGLGDLDRWAAGAVCWPAKWSWGSPAMAGLRVASSLGC